MATLGNKDKGPFVVHIPQIKGLKIYKILVEARKNADIDSYMPSLAKGKQPDREFVCNVGMLIKLNRRS